MPLIMILMVTALTITFQSLSEASTSARGSVFPATIEDGTPKVIRMKKTKVSESEEEERVMESNVAPEEQLESLAPAPILKKPRISRAQKRIEERPMHSGRAKDHDILDEPTLSPEDSANEQQVSMDSAEMPDVDMRAELSNLKKKINEELDQRLIALEQKSAPETATTVATVAAPAQSLRTAGERVPTDKIANLALRMKYAHEILKKHGIAYDYKVMTVADFKRVMQKLSQTQAEN